MHMVVLTKGVPDFREGQVSFDEDGHLERGKTPTVMNPNDRFALEAALQTRIRHGGRVSVMSMGPPGYKEVLREAMETVYADDLHLVSDREMAAADTWATAITLSAGIETLGEPDVVFAGFKTADGETGHTGPQTNWCLDMPLVTHVISLDIDEAEGTLRAKRLVEGDIEEIETVETELPAFVVADPEFEPSYRTAGERLTLKDLREETRARAENYEEHLTVRDHADINVDPDYIGLDGSPTIVSSVDPIPKAPAEREATMVDPEDTGAMQDVLGAMQSAVGDDAGDAAAAGGD
ncbi:electron transfer flavoprotein subunit beta [Haloferax sp. Atlit-10N]|uniref:electron transfer flavoprotein subunit beta/FixA family protein n=1 Tax=Haloferax TaxID=2251 RepID=UPI0006781BBB|nr:MULTISPECIES: electron transfer flavoprotein subunit beta [Haloferax]RDZ45232.1 electron transfer flavoprotein subunit beta [Haloferax sp. Atlit-16N]RDZ48597.1 electron transfer flavoprotein subunit beta [Haloferax sp. Atlit-19N]RDZ58492.1 electron transfer flavoprotein subunit beta [Haloferax sp. Atlit-10N]REA01385.1 electron transfer flavoprotein subunit beta [Haloferax sp. Atlit-6N]